MDDADFMRRLPVWDVGVRVFHWLAVGAVAVAGVTGFLLDPSWLNWHIAAGTLVAGLLLLRVIWGFTGSTYSRFANYPFSPRAVLAHLADIRRGLVHREGGHNPLGAWMVVALLITLSGLVMSGLVMLGGMFKQGPGKSVLSFDMGSLLREPHELLAYLLLGLVLAHIAGVIFESRRSRENLARAMVTGMKREGFTPAPRVFLARRWLAAALAIFTLAGAGAATLALNTRSPLGVRPIAENAAWKKDCGDCHMPFHPTLLPAQSWSVMMAGLDDHFGEDASLDAARVKEISDYLAHNAAETSDSFAANVFRNVNPAEPLRITQTPFWTRRHREIAAAVFTTAPVNAKHNCVACHSDAASGDFAPQNISIPQETAK